MAQIVKLKRSDVEGLIPHVGELALGELALNTHDGKLFTIKDDGVTSVVVEVGKESELEKLTEASGTGWRLLGANPANYGNIADDAIDLSVSKHVGNYGASARYSFAEGYETRTTGEASHVEGYKSVVLGWAAHAEGDSTQAQGPSSHAEGRSTIAQNDSMHAAGRFNVGLDPNTIHETGIGTGIADKRNAFEIFVDGRVRAPELTIAGHDDPKSLVTKEYMDTNAGPDSFLREDRILTVGPTIGNDFTNLNDALLYASTFPISAGLGAAGYSAKRNVLWNIQLDSGDVDLFIDGTLTNDSMRLEAQVNQIRIKGNADGTTRLVIPASSATSNINIKINRCNDIKFIDILEIQGRWEFSRSQLKIITEDASIPLMTMNRLWIGPNSLIEAREDIEFTVSFNMSIQCYGNTAGIKAPTVFVGDASYLDCSSIEARYLTITSSSNIKASSITLNESNPGINGAVTIIRDSHLNVSNTTTSINSQINLQEESTLVLQHLTIDATQTNVLFITPSTNSSINVRGTITNNSGYGLASIPLNEIRGDGSYITDGNLSFGGASELEKITEGSFTGWRILGKGANKASIGRDSVDFSTAFDDWSGTQGPIFGTSGDWSLASGYDNQVSGDFSAAFGAGNKATAEASFVAGEYSIASGIRSTAFGEYTIASGVASFASGDGAEASGPATQAFGNNTLASGDYAVAMGINTIASGHGSFSIGNNNNAVGVYSTAEGAYNTANGYGSHAEGAINYTGPAADFAHVEGYKNQAYGSYSHAEGTWAQAYGYASHAEGFHTFTNEDMCHVQGMYNDYKVGTIHEVGIGTANNAKANAFEIYKDGRIYAPEQTIALHDNPRSLVTKEYADAIEAGTASELDDLTDVVITSPAVDNFLKYDGANWVNTPADTLTIDGLSDVDTSGAADTDYLKYNSTSGNWEAAAQETASINDLTDVDTTTAAPTDGQVLTWDNTGSTWEPANLPAVGDGNFTGLNDTPSAFTGAGGFTVEVNAGATALEFVDNSVIDGGTF